MLCNFSYRCMTKVITNVWPSYHFRVKQQAFRYPLQGSQFRYCNGDSGAVGAYGLASAFHLISSVLSCRNQCNHFVVSVRMHVHVQKPLPYLYAHPLPTGVMTSRRISICQERISMHVRSPDSSLAELPT